MWGVRAMITHEIRAVQPSAVLEDFLCQRKSRLSSLPSYHRRSLPCVREQPFAARCPAAVSRDIRAVPSSSKLKDLFWTRTSRLFTPSGHLRSLLCVCSGPSWRFREQEVSRRHSSTFTKINIHSIPIPMHDASGRRSANSATSPRAVAARPLRCAAAPLRALSCARSSTRARMPCPSP